MKKIFFLIIVFLILLLGGAYFYNSIINQKGGSKTISYTLNNKKYKLLVATTSAEHNKGLMNYRKLDNADGMIFLFSDKNIRYFWNKNTYLDLDIYWLKDDKVVGQSFLPSIEKSKEVTIIKSPDLADKVIEIVRN